MREVRLQIPDDLADKLTRLVGEKVTDIARDAITLYNWAVEERAKGRLVLSSDKEVGHVQRLMMPSIEASKDKENP